MPGLASGFGIGDWGDPRYDEPMKIRGVSVTVGAAAGFVAASVAIAQPGRTINRSDYADRLRALWLGQCIANWTGLRTEGARIAPPFFTDADWGTTPPGGQHIDFVLNQNPWLADDDTDVEYVLLHKMSMAGHPLLTPDEIREAWLLHMDTNYLWVSNLQAWTLMGRGVRPPMTGQPVANELWAFIDAQLTTEFFGALCPGMPEEALRLADLPIRTTSFSFSQHAAQWYTVLYALALRVDPALSGRDKALWLVRQARRWIPNTSKSADIVDFVLNDFLNNPDVNNWESTRDKIHSRYMLNAAANGFHYYNWTESSVNFACGVMCLLYGQSDYKRTVQIGTLSGWDSDNCTATMGGLLGMMLGYEALAAQFPAQSFSDRFDIDRTRNNLPDYLPADPQAQDTFTLMAQRMMPLVEQSILSAGGSVDVANDQWVLPWSVIGARVESNPGRQLERRSANNRVRTQGGVVSCSASVPGVSVSIPPWTFGVGDVGMIGNGYEHDFAGRDLDDGRRYFYSTQGSGQPPGTIQSLEVTYDRPVEVWAIRFIEGDHLAVPGITGGWFQSAAVQVRVNGVWVPAAATPTGVLDHKRPYQLIDFVLAAPLQATGVRISGPSGGANGFVTCAELDALSRPVGVHRLSSRRMP